jgi:hypothetical protein
MSDDTTRPTLKEMAHMQADALHDVRALLHSLDAIVMCLPTSDANDTIQRLARMAYEGVEGVHEALDPYI